MFVKKKKKKKRKEKENYYLMQKLGKCQSLTRLKMPSFFSFISKVSVFHDEL